MGRGVPRRERAEARGAGQTFPESLERTAGNTPESARFSFEGFSAVQCARNAQHAGLQSTSHPNQLPPFYHLSARILTSGQISGGHPESLAFNCSSVYLNLPHPAFFIPSLPFSLQYRAQSIFSFGVEKPSMLARYIGRSDSILRRRTSSWPKKRPKRSCCRCSKRSS